MRAFVEQLKSRLLLSQIIGDYVRLTRKGKDFWGACPFHKERTPSFVVHDDTGRFHCFGCGEGGDAISFLEKLRHLSFREAITELATKAGLPLPTQEAFLESTTVKQPLFQALEEARLWFQEHLQMTTGATARDYLKMRHISSEAVQTFQLGWAPGSSRAGLFLSRALQDRNIPLAILESVGLVLTSREGKPGKDRFRGRLMFPIHDSQGRVVGFGGRVLGQEEPKYLNSPETSLFDKSQLLYGFWQAIQQKALQDKPVVIAEGYLDVIALQTTRIARAVAPLGTALGEAQLLKAWRLHAEPIVCFDGDAPGKTAALRTATRALSILKPGFSLLFCTLPSGEDPHSLVSKGESQTLETLLRTAIPLVDYLWERLQEMKPFQTPESQAAFRKQYKDWCHLIPHPDIRSLYERTFDGRFYELTRGKGRVRVIPQRPLPQGLREMSRKELQVQILMLTLLHHPELIPEMMASLMALTFSHPVFQKLQEALFVWSTSMPLDSCVEKSHLEKHLEQKGLSEAVNSWLDVSRVLKHAAFARKEADLQTARQGFQDVLTHYQREVALKVELEEAQATFARHMHDKSWRRFQKLKEIYAQLR